MARISKEDQERIRERIQNVATKKFNDKGYEQVSTKEIAKEVGIAEGTLFNYFDSKTHLFLDVFSQQFILEKGDLRLETTLHQDVVGMIFEHTEKLMKIFLKLPKGILTEIMLASIRLAKKHPKQFKRFVELDFQYMQDMKLFLDQLVEANIISQVNTTIVSEMIYGVIMYEFMMYMYDASYTKEKMKQQIKTKLNVLLNSYYIGG